MWSRTYNSGVKDVAVKSAADSKGNLFIAGYRSITGSSTDTSARMILIKYSASGKMLWEKVFQSSLNRRTLAYSLAIDEAGNAYICGTADTLQMNSQRAILVKYSSEGDILWTSYYGNNPSIWRNVDVKLDNAGGVYTATDVSAGGGASCLIVKYDTSGSYQWVSANYGTTPGPVLEINSAGDIFLAYSKTLGIQLMDFFLTKFDSFGSPQWTTSYNNPGNMLDYVKSMKSDPATGDIFVTGYASIFPDNPLEIQTIRFSAGIGTTMWVKRFTGTTSGGENVPLDMAVSPAGEVYLCGEITNNGTNKDGFLIRYNGMNGGERYRKIYNNTGSTTAEGISSVMVSTNEQPVALGYRAGSKDMMLQRYSTNGSVLWKYVYNDSANLVDDIPLNIIHGGEDKIFAVANYSSVFFADINVTQFDNINVSNTTLCRSTNKVTIQSEYIYDTIQVNTGASTLVRLEVIIDSLSHISPKDMSIKLKSPQGAVIDLFTNSGLNVPSTGLFGTIFSDTAAKTIDSGSVTYTGYFTPKQALETQNSYPPDGEWVLMIYHLSTGNSGTLKKWCLRMTHEATVGIQTLNNEIPEGYVLAQNYPNPFNPVTNIKFSLPESGQVSLKVYDMAGKQVAELVNGFKSAGSYIVDFNASHLSSGIYFYRLETGDFKEVRKMALVK
jgi:subtilisin-like proprotein convertase family protein